MNPRALSLSQGLFFTTWLYPHPHLPSVKEKK